MVRFNILNYTDLLGEYTSAGEGDGTFLNIKPIDQADPDSLVWINPTRKDKGVLFNNTLANLIICHIDENFKPRPGQLILKVENPKLSFVRVISEVYKPEVNYGVHPSATIHPDAKIHAETSIGPNCYIGLCEIGKGSVIKGNCHIGDGTIIKENVEISAGTVIGSDGFGYAKEEDGTMIKFPHIGGVLIEENVEIGANTCIDRGTLGMTIIKKGAKIDNLVHIAHNVVVGQNASVIALAMVGGSTIIGDRSWIAPSACLRDAINIGSDTVVGLGAVVTKSIGNGEVWAGNPARPLK